jgi:hypothetical protein
MPWQYLLVKAASKGLCVMDFNVKSLPKTRIFHRVEGFAAVALCR